jgi:hypothetical protein
MSMQTERRTDSERVSRPIRKLIMRLPTGGVGRAGEEVAGGDTEPGLGERDVVLVLEGRGDEVVVLVERVERPTLR